MLSVIARVDLNMIENVQRTLRACVGKMTYLRNSAQMVHFMPLKDFFVEDSLAFSHLFFLRTMRSHQSVAESSGLDDPEFDRWMAGTVVKHISETAAAVLGVGDPRISPHQFKVVEFYGYVGLTFEYLKLLIESSKSPDDLLSGLACGPIEARLKFDVLQSEDRHLSHYLPDGKEVEELLLSGGGGADLVIYNHDEAVHRGWAISHSLSDVVQRVTCPIVAAVRVALDGEETTRFSIRGQRVILETESALKASLHKAPGNWIFRLLPGVDDGFFLPLKSPVDDDGEEVAASSRKPGTAVMLLVRAPRNFAIKGFSQI